MQLVRIFPGSVFRFWSFPHSGSAGGFLFSKSFTFLHVDQETRLRLLVFIFSYRTASASLQPNQ